MSIRLQMNGTALVLILSLFLVSACQVKDGGGSNDLFSGHVPAENLFTMTPPPNGVYSAGNVLTFKLTHPYVLNVSGNPRLILNVGGSTAYATYQGGHGSKVLTFSYTVPSGANDNDGISVATTLDLNSGTIDFNNGVAVVTTFNVPSTAGILIDTTAPLIQGATPPAVGNYYNGLSIFFSVTFNEPVRVTGVPSINFTANECVAAGTHTKNATYRSGSGTNTLLFGYDIESTCNETTGIPVTTTIELNGGTITDMAGNNSALNFSAFMAATLPNTIQIRGRYPVVRSVTPPPAGTYVPGNQLDFVVNLDRAVTVSATTPYFLMTVGTDATKQVRYVSGAGTDKLTFRYVVLGGDEDANGVEATGPIVNPGSICSGTFCLVANQTNIFGSPFTGNVIVYAPIPRILSIQLPSPLPTSGYYRLGDQVQVVVNFSEAVTVTGGTPLLSATIGTLSKTMSYLSGSGTTNLIFTYTIQNDDIDTNGVEFISPLVLNGATIQNSTGTNADTSFTFTINPNFRFDGVAPTIVSTTVNSPAAVNHPNYRLGQYLYIDVTFSEAVTVTGSSIALTIGSNSRTATYNANVSPTVKRYRYLVQATDHTAQAASSVTVATTLAGGTIQDVALNPITDRTLPATDTTGVQVDGAVPTLTSWSPPNGGTYLLGSTLTFTATFSENVTVTGTPTLALTLDSGGPAVASYVSGTGSNSLTFTYTVDSDDLDTNGIAAAASFVFTGASITDLTGNALNNAFTAPATAVVLVDGIAPTVTGISPPNAGTYVAGTALEFTVTYSEDVVVTGFPQLNLNIGGSSKQATYVSSTGSSCLYRYTVETDLSDKDGIALTGHALNGGTIRDVSGNNAVISITPATYTSVFVDSRGPQITSITPPTDGLKVTGQSLSFIVNFDEDVVVSSGNPSLSLNIGGATLPASYVSGTGTNALTFTTNALTSAHFDPDGIDYNSTSLSLNGATMRDTLNHDANLSFTPNDLSGIKVIYSSVISLIKVNSVAGGSGTTITSISDQSSAGNNAVASSGVVTKVANDPGLGNMASAEFDGSSSLVMSGAMSVKTIAIAFRASSLPTSAELFYNGSGIMLTNGTDLYFGSNGRYAIGGGTLTGPTSSCTSCYNHSTTKVVVLNFLVPQSITPVIGNSFDGRISEIWVLDDSLTLTNAEIEKIGSYLNSSH